MDTAARTLAILSALAQHIPEAETELTYTNPFELLVSVILSAQCTDVRVNATTPALFAAYPNAKAMASADEATLFSYIRSISYPNSKARYLLGVARRLVVHHKGQVPCTIEALRALPGVGQKTAHVVASVLYNAPVIAVDTHIFRVAHRLELAPAQARTPQAVEKALCQLIPKQERAKAHHLLILHGRYTCKARKPECARCVIEPLCTYPKKTANESP